VARTRTEEIRIRVYQESVNQVIVRSLASSFHLAAILLLANAIAANAQAPTAQIDRVLFAPLDGIDQWISIRGDDRANPVLLVVHGGPGEVQWPQAEIYRPWEKSFTVVQWDQRGAGHTFGRYGTKTPDVTLDRISKDGVELAEYLCRDLGKKQIIVLGHSWGSIVATRMVQMRPELFAAYVGTGQVTSWAAMVKTVEANQGNVAGVGDQDQFFLGRLDAPEIINRGLGWCDDVILALNDEVGRVDIAGGLGQNGGKLVRKDGARR
jgi:pimeloyl-ACP methyl ester carboxylesterase